MATGGKRMRLSDVYKALDSGDFDDIPNFARAEATLAHDQQTINNDK